ncbi:Putative beta-lactamase HcpC precursor [Roseibium album]|nr:Putative beta-lactamase HcpC precursor [Roseibium album]
MKRFFAYFLPTAFVVVLVVLQVAYNPHALEKLADLGSSYAAFRLGQHYNREDSAKYDPDMALEWFEKAADGGSLDALQEIGVLHVTAAVEKPSYKTAHESFSRGAKAGHLGSMHYLAITLELGIGVEPDPMAAESWFLKVIERGNEATELSLASLHLRNQKEFGPYKVAKAFRKLHELADRGDTAALVDLAQLHIEGEGVPVNPKKGLEIYYRLADKEPYFAHELIGGFHFLGLGGEVDYTKAFEYFSKSAALGNPSSEIHLGMMYEHGLGVERDYAKAAEFYRKALDKKLIGASTNLGILYRNGTGVEQDYDEANRLFQISADIGLTQGRANVGWMLLHGWGMPLDEKRGLALIEDAAAKEDFYGAFYMALLLEDGEYVERDTERAMELYKIAADNGNQLAIIALRRLNRLN